MIIYVGNPKNSTKELIEQMREYNMVAGYKVNIEKLVALYVPAINN